MNRNPRPLSALHKRVLRSALDLPVVTPTGLGRRLSPFKGDARAAQTWGYLQLARLTQRGYMRKTGRGTYTITKKGRESVPVRGVKK